MAASSSGSSLAERLRVLRAQRGYTLAQASAKTGVRLGTLSALERGGRTPQIPTLTKIAKGYGVPVEDLLHFDLEANTPREELSRTQAQEDASTERGRLMAASQKRVVLVVEGDRIDVLEAPEGLTFEVIDWDCIQDLATDRDYDLLDELAAAITAGKTDKALAIAKAFTEDDPRNDGEDPRAIDRSWGMP